MSIPCDYQSLVTGATPLRDIPAGMQMAAAIYLAAQIAGVDVSSSTAINNLVAAAQPLQAIDPGMQWPVAISLACTIANA